jgi:16S rRNA (uracil1498-N3)-methyltransferase
MRLHVGAGAFGDRPQPGDLRPLPDAAARHLQVLRAQPGERVECFDGAGHAWWVEVAEMQRRSVTVRLLAPAEPAPTELPAAVTLAVAMPANDRMDDLVEKATELGVSAVQPLVCSRSVLRLSGERAERRVAHWASVAAGAAEQCGRRVVPRVLPVAGFEAWIATCATARGAATGWLLSLDPQAPAAAATRALPGSDPVCVLSGPEGGLTPDEEEAARAAGFRPVSLGPRVLRADTAPLAWLAHAGLAAAAPVRG